MGELFEPSVRPDLAVMSDSTVSVLELTVCHKTNFLKSRQYKLDKYSHLGQKLMNSLSSKTLEYFTIEVSTLGFMSDINEFLKSANLPNLPQSIAISIIKKTIFQSQDIYCRRSDTMKRAVKIDAFSYTLWGRP